MKGEGVELRRKAEKWRVNDRYDKLHAYRKIIL